MTNPDASPRPPEPAGPSRNDRLKERYPNVFWGSLLAATLAHVLVFLLVPAFATDLSANDGFEFEVIDIPPELDIPPPPEELRRPAEPVISELDLLEDLTIPRTTWEEHPPEELARPRTERVVDVRDEPTFVPHTLAPEILRPDEVRRALQREYPSVLRNAGIGGVVQVWVLVGTGGEAMDARVDASSGHDSMDQAALRVARTIEFSPAMNRDERVAVWVSIPIRFEPRD